MVALPEAPMFNPTDQIVFTYPLQTHVRSIGATGFQQREVVVRRVRDLVKDPLTPTEFVRRPFVNRSRWLILGHDKSTSQLRQFYLGSSKEFAAPAQLRLAWYELGGNKPIDIVYRSIEPTVKDRKALSREISRLTAHEPDAGRVLRIYCDDMRLVG